MATAGPQIYVSCSTPTLNGTPMNDIDELTALLINNADGSQEALEKLVAFMREGRARADAGLKPIKTVVPKQKQMPSSVMEALRKSVAPQQPQQKMRRS